MSQINTNGIDVNYPVPGKNNSTQGFRNNFAQIKNQIDTGASEITDLQNKVVLKAALNNSALNNDMANTLISNASTSGFRATTYNLGSALAGPVIVDVNRADVQYGTVAGNVVLQFGGWAPTNTESNVVLRLAVSDPSYTVSLPEACVSSNNNFGVTLLENYQDVDGVATLTAPADTTIIEYVFSTLDCGETISVSPINRPFQSTQILTRTPPPTGVPGDIAGTVAVDANYLYVCTSTFDSTIEEKKLGNTFSGNLVQLENTVGLAVNAPIIFTGNVANTNIVDGAVYYIKNIVNQNASPGNITISATRTSGVAGPEVAIGVVANANANSTSYIGTNIWKRVALNTW